MREPIRLTYDEYDKKAEDAEHMKMERNNYWPSEEEVYGILEGNFENTMDFLIWLSESETPITPEERASHLAINDVLMSNIDFVEDDAEPAIP